MMILLSINDTATAYERHLTNSGVYVILSMWSDNDTTSAYATTHCDPLLQGGVEQCIAEKWGGHACE